MQSIETDDVLFSILNGDTTLKAAISGGVYVAGERPDNSELEDIVTNCLSLTHDNPQSGVSNVNIHVPDLIVKIRGSQQRKTDRERIRTITALVLQALNAARVTGLTLKVASEYVIKEPNINQSYNNIRVEWLITSAAAAPALPEPPATQEPAATSEDEEENS